MSLDQSLVTRRAELERLGFQVLQVEPETLIAGRRSFYWDCIFTYVNYTVFVRRVTALSVQMLESERTQFLLRSKTLNPSSFQYGNAVLVVYIADQVDIDAQLFCEHQIRLRFAQFYIPAALDLSCESTFLLRRTPLLGGVYYSKFRYILIRLLSPRGMPNQEPLSISGVIATLLALFSWIIFPLILLLFVSRR
jgi:hypothetical protein